MTVPLGFPINAREVLLTAVTTLGVDALGSIILGQTSGGGFTLTLPSAAAVGAGGQFFIIAPRGDLGVLSVALGGSTFNDGQAGPIALNTANASLIVTSNGTNYTAFVGDGTTAPSAGDMVFTATVLIGDTTAATSEIVRVDPSGGTFTVFAPPAPATNDQFGAKNETTDTTALTFDGNGSSIEGLLTYTPAATVVFGGDGMAPLWKYNGAVWELI